MARSDLLLSLIRAGNSGDQKTFRQAVEAIIAEERAKQHHVLADQLASLLNRQQHPVGNSHAPIGSSVQDLFFETTPVRALGDLILPVSVKSIFQELIEEHHRVELLHSYGLEPRHRILLTGPPGCGKTSIAEALAHGLMVPLFTVRYESIIGSFLGETAGRLKRMFDMVRLRRCVLFLDEFDAIGKERGDIHETGEIKRVVSSLLLQIDALPSHVVVVTASNHPELLDRAVWRRFQVRVVLPLPEPAQLAEMFERFQETFEHPLGISPRTLASRLSGKSFAEVEEFIADIQRRYVLSLPVVDMKAIISSRLKQWQVQSDASNIKIESG